MNLADQGAESYRLLFGQGSFNSTLPDDEGMHTHQQVPQVGPYCPFPRPERRQDTSQSTCIMEPMRDLERELEMFRSFWIVELDEILGRCGLRDKGDAFAADGQGLK